MKKKTDEALLTINELKHSELKGNFYRVNKEITNSKEFDKPFQSDNAERLTKEELQELLINWRNYENTCFELR